MQQLKWKFKEIFLLKKFFKKIRKLCNQNGIVLIFDECTSGFRQNFGGLHKLYGVNPDIAWFGKALGNGYAITAIIGKNEIMESAQNSFISSTFLDRKNWSDSGNKNFGRNGKNKILGNNYKNWKLY